VPRASRRSEAPSTHLVPDVLAPGLDLVFCGTAPSPISFQRRAYYANPGNTFWSTLHRVGLLPERFEPTRYPEVLQHGIGLTDLNKT
jgi:double-stranded uracil-DNA glycosylase